MYEFRQIDFHSLTSDNNLSQSAQRALADKTADQQVIAFQALLQNVPIGLCIALLNPVLHFAEFLYIEVDLLNRNRGIGRALIAKTQAEAVQRGAKFFSLVYPLNDPQTLATEKILKANNWKGSRPFLIRARFKMETFDTPMVHLHYRYPKDFEEFAWKDLDAEQRKDLLYREKEGHFSRSVSPFLEENIQEPLNSLGLRKEGRVVGWLITHRLDHETIRYSCFYIEPSLKFRAFAMKLLADAILLHMNQKTRWALIEIPILQVSPSWIAFVKKRLLPFAFEITHLQQAWHEI